MDGRQIPALEQRVKFLARKIVKVDPGRAHLCSARWQRRFAQRCPGGIDAYVLAASIEEITHPIEAQLVEHPQGLLETIGDPRWLVRVRSQYDRNAALPNQ